MAAVVKYECPLWRRLQSQRRRRRRDARVTVSRPDGGRSRSRFVFINLTLSTVVIVRHRSPTSLFSHHAGLLCVGGRGGRE